MYVRMQLEKEKKETKKRICKDKLNSVNCLHIPFSLKAISKQFGYNEFPNHCHNLRNLLTNYCQQYPSRRE
jgi:hypothetical protein